MCPLHIPPAACAWPILQKHGGGISRGERGGHVSAVPNKPTLQMPSHFCSGKGHVLRVQEPLPLPLELQHPLCVQDLAGGHRPRLVSHCGPDVLAFLSARQYCFPYGSSYGRSLPNLQAENIHAVPVAASTAPTPTRSRRIATLSWAPSPSCACRACDPAKKLARTSAGAIFTQESSRTSKRLCGYAIPLPIL